MTYAEKLKDPRWQRKRLEVMQRDDFTCQSCNSKTETLQVHHAYYLPKFAPWDYPAESLVTLCDKCHEEQTGRIPRLMMQNMTPRDTMINTELLELTNSSPQTSGTVMELALALRLLGDEDYMGAYDVINPVMETLKEIADEIESKFFGSIK